MLQTMSTGHAGSMSTVHANTPQEALWRLEMLAMAGDPGFGVETLRHQMYAALDLVVQVERVDGRRRVHSVAAVPDRPGEDVEEVWCPS